jgi:exopolyphosphatase / guanosine-5'-triphosphate,3'-diphosphate pyrophosphatase
MPVERHAVIDVGTNSVKLLVAEVSPQGVHPLFETGCQTRLGSGSYESRRLSQAAIARTARAIAGFVAESARWHPRAPRVIGTSAARDAANPEELRAAVREICGLEMEILSGEQEADWAFLGVASDPALRRRPLLIVDAGGGSTEFIVGEGVQSHFRRSFRLGTVRLLERLKPADPPTEEDWAHCQRLVEAVFDREICPSVGPALTAFHGRKTQLVGTSGTTSILARIAAGLATFDRDRIEATRLSLLQVRREREHLWRLPLAERRRVPGLPGDRADVILTGVAIYEAVMDKLGFAGLRVSARGLRFAAVQDAARRASRSAPSQSGSSPERHRT